MPHFMILSILYINLLNLSWTKNCLFLRNMEPLILEHINFFEFAASDLSLNCLLRPVSSIGRHYG